MNQDWNTFLARHGATIESGIVQHFGAPADELASAAEGAVMCDLSQFGTLRVSGEDATAFLQNLLSNDVREINSARAQFSSLNTAKGRVLATLLMWRDGEDYLLQLPRVQCEGIRKKLSMYVLRAKVMITDASDEIISMGVSGPLAREVMLKQFGDLPRAQYGNIGTPRGSVIQIGDDRWQVNTSAPHAASLWEALSQHLRPVGSACWDWLNIRSGIPVIYPRTQEQLVAQMVNLDLTGGISFQKGCYPGQEIVARTQYLGKLKRRMYLAHLDQLELADNSEFPKPGDELYSAEMGGQACGMIVDAAPAPDGGFDVLASVQISSRETQSVHWASLQGTALEFLPMPYELPAS